MDWFLTSGVIFSGSFGYICLLFSGILWRNSASLKCLTAVFLSPNLELKLRNLFTFMGRT